jgi:hypothetical protein
MAHGHRHVARDPRPQPAPQPAPADSVVDDVSEDVTDGAATTSEAAKPDPTPTSAEAATPSEEKSEDTPTPTPVTSPTTKTTAKTQVPTVTSVKQPIVVETTVKSLQPTLTEDVAQLTTVVPTAKEDKQTTTTPTVVAVTKEESENVETTVDSIPTAITSPVDAIDVPTTLLQATTQPSAVTDVDSIASGTLTVATPASTSTGESGTDVSSGSSSSSSSGGDSSSSNGSSSGGTSSAAKAGIGLGVAAGILLVIVAAWFLYSRRKKQQARQPLEEDDEKTNSALGALDNSRDTRTGLKRMSLAPRLSLHRTTQAFTPTAASFAERRQSKNLSLNAAAVATAGGGAWDHTTGTPTSNNPDNPFGNYAERMSTPSRELDQAEPVSPISSSSHEPSDYISKEARISEETISAAAVGPMITPAVPLTRKASARKDGLHALDLTRVQPPPVLSVVPPSPAGTEYSNSIMSPGMAPPMTNGAAAIAAAGGPEASAVHRVQLDFVPSMDDEMPLQVGQLVRMLHEYDDGWAFCIRLDRTQQGVVPRTCLSARPVKPRKPQGAGRSGPPVKPQMAQGPPRSGPPHPQALRPTSPQNGRMSPANGRTSPSPSQGRVSPPQGRGSPTQGRVSPPHGRLSPTNSGHTTSRSVSPQDERDYPPPTGLAPRPQSPIGRPVSPSGAPGMAM